MLVCKSFARKKPYLYSYFLLLEILSLKKLLQVSFFQGKGNSIFEGTIPLKDFFKEMITNWTYFIDLGKYEPAPTVLHEVSVPIISNAECEDWLFDAGLSKYFPTIPNIMMCAGLEKGGKDACQVKILQ
jgi:hypothetical protein